MLVEGQIKQLAVQPSPEGKTSSIAIALLRKIEQRTDRSAHYQNNISMKTSNDQKTKNSQKRNNLKAESVEHEQKIKKIKESARNVTPTPEKKRLNFKKYKPRPKLPPPIKEEPEVPERLKQKSKPVFFQEEKYSVSLEIINYFISL